jgi:hypothetical protein
MTCPKCHSEFEGDAGICPECGVSLLRNVSGVMKTSIVMISAGGESGFYRSVQDVPEPLRKQLLETTTSHNSGTIVIADRAGKEQITQVLARRDAAAAPDTLPPAVEAEVEADAEAVPAPAHRIAWLAWAGMALVLVLAVIFAIFFELHW